MALPVIFGPLTAADMGQLDQDFAAVGALTTIQCGAAVGTNALVLTPAANQPALSGYGLPNPVKFAFTAAATSTGSVTLEVSTFGFLPVYTPDGVQATTGTLASGQFYEVTYTTGTNYNSGNGAWVLSSYQAGTGLIVLAGSSARGLKIVNNAGTPSTKIDISFQQACLVSATGTPVFLGILSATIDLTTGTVTSTANGMDGESRPASGWVYIYAISTGTGMAGLGTTTSPLAGPPTLPAGYAYYGYLGAMYCDGSSNLKRTQQLGIDTQYTVVAGSNTPIPPIIASGVQGTFSNTNPAFASASISTLVPPTASKITVMMAVDWKGGGINNGALAPNSSYGGTNNGLLGTVGMIPPLSQQGASANSWASTMQLESTNVYVIGQAGTAFACLGWTDYASCAA